MSSKWSLKARILLAGAVITFFSGGGLAFTESSSKLGDAATSLPAQNLRVLGRVTNDVTSRRQLRVIAVGSSSTYGIGASSRSKTYPAQLEALLRERLPNIDVNVLNLGVSGETSASAAHRISAEIMQLDPGLVIWQAGSIDGITKTPIGEFENTIRQTLRLLKARKIDTVLIDGQWTPELDKSSHYKATNSALARIGAEEGVPLVSRYAHMQLVGHSVGVDHLLSDGFHLNDQGYRDMAKQIASEIVCHLEPCRGGEQRI
jgi:acyl-CoA thioesterase I